MTGLRDGPIGGLLGRLLRGTGAVLGGSGLGAGRQVDGIAVIHVGSAAPRPLARRACRPGHHRGLTAGVTGVFGFGAVACGAGTIALVAHRMPFVWVSGGHYPVSTLVEYSVEQGRQDLNLQPAVLETAALPVELRPFAGVRGLHNSRAPRSVDLNRRTARWTGKTPRSECSAHPVSVTNRTCRLITHRRPSASPGRFPDPTSPRSSCRPRGPSSWCRPPARCHRRRWCRCCG